MAVTRRELLMGLTGGALLEGLGPRAAAEGSTRWVVLVLAGGADGLTIAPPYSDPGYYRARPTLAVPPPTAGRDSTIALTRTTGLHPALGGLHELWERRELGILHGVAPGSGQDLEDHERARLQQLALFRSLLVAPQAEELRDSPVTAEWHGLSALQELSSKIALGTAPELSLIQCAGWDTHVGQGGVTGPLSESLSELSSAVKQFVGSLGEQWRTTRVVVTTEFGRSVAENALEGTDHGSGFSMLILGQTPFGGQVLGMREGCSELVERRNTVPPVLELAGIVKRLDGPGVV